MFILDPGIEKAPDPGSGSATLPKRRNLPISLIVVFFLLGERQFQPNLSELVYLNTRVEPCPSPALDLNKGMNNVIRPIGSSQKWYRYSQPSGSGGSVIKWPPKSVTSLFYQRLKE
jgi:hypothetical protein